MSNSKLISPTPAAKLEDDALLAGEVVAGTLRGALVLGLLAAVVSTPYLLVRHFRGNHDHLPLLARRLRGAARALAGLLPHRIVADARKLDR
jgi:hypothetical protein